MPRLVGREMLAAEVQPAVRAPEHRGEARHLAGPEIGPRAAGISIRAPRVQADQLELIPRRGPQRLDGGDHGAAGVRRRQAIERRGRVAR